jgi:hypothetical protein
LVLVAKEFLKRMLSNHYRSMRRFIGFNLASEAGCTMSAKEHPGCKNVHVDISMNRTAIEDKCC